MSRGIYRIFRTRQELDEFVKLVSEPRSHARAQMLRDTMIITLHSDFGWGEKRITELMTAYDKNLDEFCKMVVGDVKEDFEIAYTKERIDRILKEALGDKFEPWEVRYPDCF